ncbi:uncharacterized protein LOC143287916 [Babylonia areolata]|uniref:uncharacterized protein LOC143287916 n=1 Tax=Babylonia areolata TaxID=304850 RepID=UPI003FD46AEC
MSDTELEMKEAGGSFDLSELLVEVEGVFLPRAFETDRPMKEHVECLKALDMRHDDVILVAFPKAGTHWLWEITSMLLAGKAEHEKRVKELAMMEATAIGHIQAQPSPRVLNSHLPLRLLPRQIREKKVKVIHVYRNVKDALVSAYFHFRQFPPMRGISIESILQMWRVGDVPGQKYVDFMKETDEFHRTNPDVPFFITSFEDIKEEPEKVIWELAEFLGVEASPQLCRDILEATRLDKMKEADKIKQQSHIPQASVYRKGQVGDWKNHLTVAQSEQLDAEVTQLKSCDYHFRYTFPNTLEWGDIMGTIIREEEEEEEEEQEAKAEDTAEKETGSGLSAMFREVEGATIPAPFEVSCKRPLAQHVELLKGLGMRSDDVMIVAYMKAGTHWIWEVASMLLSGKVQYEKRTKELAMMEATEFEKLESQPSPRIFNTHLPFRLLPRQVKDRKVRIIHVYRNVKDVLVSMCFHMRQVPSQKDLTFEYALRWMTDPEVPGEKYITYLKEMDQYRKCNTDMPFFTMSYEDTKEDPEKAIQKLGEFLGVRLTPQLVTDIAQATSFANMKQADNAKEQHSALPEIKMYRKGQVGDWKNYLTVAQSERLDAAMTQLESCDYRFRYTL